VSKRKIHLEDATSAKETKKPSEPNPRKKIKDNYKQNHYIQENLPRSR
jgi:hypothetical protein